GERNIVEVVKDIVDIEGRPAAIAALHALNPLNTSINGRIVTRTGSCPARTIHRHYDNGCVVEVGIVWICILKRPTTGAHVRAPGDPVPGNVEHLTRAKPIKRPDSRGNRLLVGDFQ